MASSGDTKKNFKRSQPSPLSLCQILGTGSAVRNTTGIPHNRPREEELADKNCVAGDLPEKRGLLVIDLNVAPPPEDDDGSEFPASGDGGNGLRMDSGVASEMKLSSGDENDLNFGVVAEGRCSRNRMQPHLSNGETVNGFSAVKEQEAKRIKLLNISSTDSVAERKLRKEARRNRRWNALLQVAKNSLQEQVEEENRKRRPSRRVEIGELHTGKTRKNLAAHKRHSFAGELNNTNCGAAPAVVRSTRGRAVAMPNKYRDSVLVTAADFPRHNRSNSKSSAAGAHKRKSR